jgi:hypothetical protein
MIFLYENSSKIPSIYEIKNLHSQRSYIGQTVKPKSRWAGHKNSLIRGRHGNRFLLADYSELLTGQACELLKSLSLEL